jgi:hypothetical protein
MIPRSAPPPMIRLVALIQHRFPIYYIAPYVPQRFYAFCIRPVDQRDGVDAVDVYFARAGADDVGVVVCVPLRDFLVILVVW